MTTKTIMEKNNRVVIVEDDVFARDQLLNTLSRDWRTRVVGEFDSFSKRDFADFLNDPSNKIDTIILDTEVPWNPNWPIEAFEIIEALDDSPKIIFLCTVPIPRYWNEILLHFDFYGGYLVKQEILFCLPSAVNLAADGSIVLTESILRLPVPEDLQKKMLVLDGGKMVREFTPRELDVLRLGIILGHSQRDIENELVISRDWISELLGDVYQKLQIPDLISGEVKAEDLIMDQAVLAQVAEILSGFDGDRSEKNLRRIPWLSTLAFHLFTIPEIREL
jgi:DNA-binding NarL/FixJ family response regulator